MGQRTSLFISYNHKDEKWRSQLELHLTPYIQRGDLELWDDRRIDAGDVWRSAIRDAIDRAAASVLLISADFVASKFIVSEELPRLLRNAEKNGARILAITVRPWQSDAYPQIACFQGLNSPDKPLSLLKPKAKAEEFLVRAARQIAQLLRESPAHGAGTAPGPAAPESADEQLVREVETATILLSVLDALRERDGSRPAHTISDLERIADIQSRKLLVAGVNRLFCAGWVDKRRTQNLTRFSITDRGILQAKRLAELADGPFRRNR